MEIFFCIISLLTFILLVFQSAEVLPKPQDPEIDDTALRFDKYWLGVEAGLNFILFLDPFLRLALLGKFL